MVITDDDLVPFHHLEAAFKQVKDKNSLDQSVLQKFMDKAEEDGEEQVKKSKVTNVKQVKAHKQLALANFLNEELIQNRQNIFYNQKKIEFLESAFVGKARNFEEADDFIDKFNECVNIEIDPKHPGRNSSHYIIEAKESWEHELSQFTGKMEIKDTGETASTMSGGKQSSLAGAGKSAQEQAA